VLTSQGKDNQTEFLNATKRCGENDGEFGTPLTLQSIKTMRPGKYHLYNVF